MRHEFQFFFPWWMVMTIIYYSRSFWVQKTFSLPLTKPPIYCMGGKYFFSSGCLAITSLLFYKWNRCRYVTVHYDTMLFGYKLWGYRNVPLYILAICIATCYCKYIHPPKFILWNTIFLSLFLRFVLHAKIMYC